MAPRAVKDVYFSADVEADGPIPGRYSMLSFAMVVAGTFDGQRFERVDPTHDTFYRELRPISEHVDERALAVSGLDREKLLREGAEPAVAMSDAANWVREVAGDRQAVLVAMPVAFDWAWLHWYFTAFTDGGSPFGVSSCFDIRTAFAVKAGLPLARAHRSDMPEAILTKHPHTHHALDDAVEQADLFANLFEWSPNGAGD